jgi:putative alpha-1,2-mannosidase
MNMSPTGNLLAIGGETSFDGGPTTGLEVFHFNGAGPITPYSAVLTSAPINQIHWDKNNHLYALSDSTNKLYVYTVTPTTITKVAGSPFTVASPGANALVVVPIK